MTKVIFAITELQKPVGGLHRFATELLPAWRRTFAQGKTDYEPLPVAPKLGLEPAGDLVPAKEFEGLTKAQPHLRVFEGERAGERCYFLESDFPQEEMNAFYGKLWEDYRIPSLRSSQAGFYAFSAQYWKSLPMFAEYAQKKLKWKFSLVDAQDWMAFPAGFLTKQLLGLPLHCRFHSGEFGRSLGHPDLESGPVWIEAAALQEADAISGVSPQEARFTLYNLLPLKRKLRKMLSDSRGPAWAHRQEDKEEAYDYALLFESENGMALFTQHAMGVPNGIILDSWKKVPKPDIAAGRALLRKLLPGKKNFVFFIGRADWRKGIDALFRAMALVAQDDLSAGLVVSSQMDPDAYANYYGLASSLGISEDVAFYTDWLPEERKKALFCASDAIALPSLYEPFGLVALEALAADLACEKNGLVGPAVITSDTGGMHGILRNGVNGFKVPMEPDRFDLQPELLAKILKLVLSDDRLRAKLSKGGAARVQEECFDWNRIVHWVFTAYDRAAENRALEKD